MSTVLTRILFVAFVIFSLGGFYMGWTYQQEWKLLSQKAAESHDQSAKTLQDILHAKGIALASYIASAGMIVIGTVICGIVYFTLTTLEALSAASSGP